MSGRTLSRGGRIPAAGLSCLRRARLKTARWDPQPCRQSGRTGSWGGSATLGLPETRWGILAGAGGTQRLARLIGPGSAKRLMYTARPVDANEALRLGLVEVVSHDDDPLADAVGLAREIAANSPRAVRSIKRCVDEGLGHDLAEGLRIERELWIDLIPDGDLQEGAAAFFARRPPRYPA